MMNMRKNIKGITLVEVVLAIAIFATIAFPLLSVFVQSMKVSKQSDDVLKANYISQNYLEQLDKKTYELALGSTTDEVKGDNNEYILTKKITPYGTLNYLFGQPNCSYIHIIILKTGEVLCVMPDGKSHKYGSLPATFSITISYKSYTFNGGYTSITGDSEYNYCAVLVNAMQKTAGVKSAITLNGNCKAALYCTDAGSGDITFSGGSSSVFADLIDCDKSLIFVKTALYDASKENVIATSDSYINIKNW